MITVRSLIASAVTIEDVRSYIVTASVRLNVHTDARLSFIDNLHRLAKTRKMTTDEHMRAYKMSRLLLMAHWRVKQITGT